MKLPFVSRGKHEMAFTLHIAVRDQMQSRLDSVSASRDSYKALFEAERERCDRLTEKLLAMKQQGFQTATERREAAPVVVPSKIEEAIQSKAGANVALRRHLSNVAAGMQRANKPDEEIVETLTKWRSDDEESDEHEGRS